MTTRLLGLIAVTALSCLLTADSTLAQDPLAPQAPARMFGEVEKPLESRSTGQPSVQELRQARALYQSQQRIERLERRAWSGHEPLRPVWNAVPMTSSRYPYRNTIYVPVFYYGR